MSDNEPSPVQHFARHMIGIGATQIQGNPPVTSAFFIVGFIISVKDNWFFITAGHCLEKLRKAMETSKIDNISLIDYMGSQAGDQNPIPFDYEGSFKCYVNNERTGIDAGFVHIRPHYRRLLEANGIVAHDEVQWKRQPDEFEVAWMLGIPCATVQSMGQKGYSFSANMIPLEILPSTPQQFVDESPSDLTEQESLQRDSLFYARIPGDVALPRNKLGDDDIDGMSGGPIFGFANSMGKSKYWVTAVQNSWFPTSRVIRGTPFKQIGDSMEKFVDRLMSGDLASSEPEE